MAEMKLDRPYMELQSGSDIAFGGFPIYMPQTDNNHVRIEASLRGFQEAIEEMKPVVDLVDVAALISTIENIAIIMQRIDERLERWETPWYVRFWNWLSRS